MSKRIKGPNGTIEVSDVVAEMLLRNKGDFTVVGEQTAPAASDAPAKPKGKAGKTGKAGKGAASKGTEPDGMHTPPSTPPQTGEETPQPKPEPSSTSDAEPAGNASTEAWAEYGIRRGVKVDGLNRTQIREAIAALDSK